MKTISIEEAQATLSDLVHGLAPGDEVVITENDLPVARLAPAVPQDTVRPAIRPGTLRGTVQYPAPDFDAPLGDFREYMERGPWSTRIR